MDWYKIKDKLPPEYTLVLAWDKKRGFTISKWLDRKDCKKGEYWIVNGSSGGVGTNMHVYPPTLWCKLPEKPKTGKK